MSKGQAKKVISTSVDKNVTLKIKRRIPCIRVYQLWKEDVIYDSTEGNVYSIENDIRIVNKINRFTNSTRTIAKCSKGNGVIEKTSDGVIGLIGQRNYDIVMKALCSVLNEEAKVRAIYALLTAHSRRSVGLQCSADRADAACQTGEPASASRKRKRQPRPYSAPYVIPSGPKRIIIDPTQFSAILPDLSACYDNSSNDSIGNLSSFSVTTTNTLMQDPLSLLEMAECKTAPRVATPSPEPPTPQPSQHVLDALKLWNACIEPDSDGNLPLHVAVMAEDAQRVHMQALALRSRSQSIDTPGADGWTALHLALAHNEPGITRLLLSFGADPLLSDEEGRDAFHQAAESSTAQLQVLIDHCRDNATELFERANGLLGGDDDRKPPADLGAALLRRLCARRDAEGRTPLMAAVNRGLADNVALLLRHAPSSVHCRASTSGNTALHFAVGACITEPGGATADRLNTVEALIKGGADTCVENHAGCDVNRLLNESREVSMLVAERLSSSRLFGSAASAASVKWLEYMLVKEGKSVSVERIAGGHVTAREQRRVAADELQGARGVNLELAAGSHLLHKR